MFGGEVWSVTKVLCLIGAMVKDLQGQEASLFTKGWDIISSWQFPPPNFVKVNADGSAL